MKIPSYLDTICKNIIDKSKLISIKSLGMTSE